MNSNVNVFAEKSIGELVANDYRTADIFKRYGIDFCCGGKKKLDEVCQTKGIDMAEFLQVMEEFLAQPASGTAPDYANWNLDFLVEYIINVHHRYVKDNLPVLDEYSNKVAKVHGGGNPDLLVLRNLFIDLTQELTPHLRKEELILFPYISRMAKYMVSDDEGQMPSFAFANGPIGVMEAEHEVAGEIIHKMQKITDNFNPPDQACNTWRVLYAKLNEFAEDLFEHIHLENNVLFPAAIKMENELLDSKTA